MSGLVIAGNTSGSVTLDAPAIAGSTVITLPGTSGTMLTTTSAATGTGDLVKATAPTLSSPVLVTPNLGTPSAAVLTNATGTANSLNAGIGVNQTWQNVTASRAAGTTYTNSTGKPIQVNIIVNQNNAGNSLTVGGIVVATSVIVSGYSLPQTVSAIVPAGTTYSLSAGTFSSWLELRQDKL